MSKIEKTLSIIKPDAVERNLVEDIKNIFLKNDLKIKMSLTAPGCPVAGEMPGQVANTLAKIPNVGLIEVELVWEPAWTKDRMSEDAKLALDIY